MRFFALMPAKAGIASAARVSIGWSPLSRDERKADSRMRVLAIDTALEACSAAVLDLDRGGIVASETIPMVRGHAEALMPLIARVMDLAEAEFAGLDRISVTTGPGSFTGLRVGISAARGLALASGKPAIGLSTLSGFAAPHIAEDDTSNSVVAAIDARHDHVYLQIFGTNGRTVVAPRIAPLREAVRAAMTAPGAASVGSAANLLAASGRRCRAAAADRAAQRARHRLDRAARRRRRRWLCVAQASLPARARRAAAGRGAAAAAMMGFLARWFARSEPVLSEAGPRDAEAIARCMLPRFIAAGATARSNACCAIVTCSRTAR